MYKGTNLTLEQISVWDWKSQVINVLLQDITTCLSVLKKDNFVKNSIIYYIYPQDLHTALK